jgi:hypothetical protein
VDVSRSYGAAASGGAAIVAAVIVGLGIGAASSSFGPSDRLLRGVVLGGIVAAPGLVGLLGTRRRDPVLLAGAGIACLAVSWISIATLALAVVGLLYLGAAWAARGSRPSLGWLLAPVLAVLVGGGLATVLATTEERCWVAFELLGGGLEFRDATPAEAGGPFGPGLPVAGGCDTGVLTLPGLFGGLGLPAAAVVLAAGRRGFGGRPTETA